MRFVSCFCFIYPSPLFSIMLCSSLFVRPCSIFFLFCSKCNDLTKGALTRKQSLNKEFRLSFFVSKPSSFEHSERRCQKIHREKNTFSSTVFSSYQCVLCFESKYYKFFSIHISGVQSASIFASFGSFGKSCSLPLVL